GGRPDGAGRRLHGGGGEVRRVPRALSRGLERAARAGEPRHAHRHARCTRRGGAPEPGGHAPAPGGRAAARGAGAARARPGTGAARGRAPQDRSGEDEGDRPEAGADAMKRKILVVDDDAAIVEVLEMRLTAMGYDVIATADPQAAVSAVESTRFDLALIDLRMEPMDGIALMEAVHNRQQRLPVLIMTAHGTIETAVDAVQRGAFDYLTKPFQRDELRAKILRALASRRWARDRERLL